MTALEQSLKTLIDRYDSLIAVNRELAAQVSEKERRISDLERKNKALQDAMAHGREDAARVKKLEQERSHIRTELDRAMERLQALERGL